MKPLLLLSIILLLTVGQPARAAVDIYPVEYDLVNAPTPPDGECYAGLSPAGRVLFETCDPTPPTVKQYDLIGGQGILTHSHPDNGRACWTLSPADLTFAWQANLFEIRAVSVRDGVLRVAAMRRTETRFASIPPNAVDDVSRREAAKDADIMDCAYLDRTWRTLAPAFGLEYTVVEQPLSQR